MVVMSLLLLIPVAKRNRVLWYPLITAATLFMIVWFVTTIVYMASNTFSNGIEDEGHRMDCWGESIGDDRCKYWTSWRDLWRYSLAALIIAPILFIGGAITGHLTTIPKGAYVVEKRTVVV